MATGALAPLWHELHRRFCEGDPPTTVTLRELDVEHRRALADLLASDRLPRSTVRLRVDRLSRALGCADVDDLRAEVVRRCGPIVDRRGARQALHAARAGLWEWLSQQVADIPLAADSDVLEPWVGGLRASGVPGGDVAAHRRRLAAVVAVLRSLPRAGASLAGVADDVVGDPHALDHGRAAARNVLDAVALLIGRDRPADAEEARLLWEDVGVVPDPLSSTVLALGLRPSGDEALAVWLRAASEAGEPVVLTLAQLRRWPMQPLASGEIAYVVENPSLLAEATAQTPSWRGPPLVCSSGRPTVAVATLLRQLGAGGAELRQHADFDRVGLGITSWLADRAGTTPWHMSADSYRTVVSRPRDRVSLTGLLPPTPWDPDLRDAMTRWGVAVYEEEVRAGLLDAMRV